MSTSDFFHDLCQLRCFPTPKIKTLKNNNGVESENKFERPKKKV